MSVTYTAVLEVSEDSVVFPSALLHAERLRRTAGYGSNGLVARHRDDITGASGLQPAAELESCP